jgi:hypothetical protein
VPFGSLHVIDNQMPLPGSTRDSPETILDGICTALDAPDLERAEPAIERNARTHGKVRWQQGYRIDELVHELDLFRQVLADAAEAFAESNDTFTRRHERRSQAAANRSSESDPLLTTKPAILWTSTKQVRWTALQPPGDSSMPLEEWSKTTRPAVQRKAASV